MGLAYKPDIDDLRESPALEIVHDLEKMKFKVLAVEPNVSRHRDLQITDSAKAALEADIIVFLVAHKEFRKLSVEKEKVVMDFCGVIR